MLECPVEFSLLILKNKWTIFIVRELITGPKRFGELKRSLKGISAKMLTENLKHLEVKQIVLRTAFDEIPPKVSYSLAPLGLSLKPVLDALAQWGLDHYADLA